MGLAISAAVLIDLLLGEPKTRYHPIALLGLMMAKADVASRTLVRGAWSKKAAGLITVCLFVGFAGVAGRTLLFWAGRTAPVFGWAAQSLLIWLSISVGELVAINKKINRALRAGEIETARILLRSLVGRDCGSLNEAQIRGAALESLAENLVDGGIAPLFYAFIGGGSLAIVYRTINTLDSMFGYKDVKYIDFGWAAARLDDVASWLPARLAVAGLVLAGGLLGMGWRRGIKTALIDGGKHPSPNSGLPIAALAGSLDIRLGGARLYGERSAFYGFFGRGLKPIDARTVGSAAGLTLAAWVISAAGGIMISVYFRGAQWLIASG